MAAARTPGPARAKSALIACVATAGLLGAGAATFAGSASAAATNLLVNPGFETGNLSGWTCDAGTGSVVTSPTHSGSYALAGAANNSDDAQCAQTVSVLPNTQYTLSGYVEGAYVYIGVTGGASTWTPSATSWQQLSVTFTTGASQTSAQVYLHGWYAQGTYHADDVALTGPAGTASPTPSPTSQSPTPSPTPSPSKSPSPSPSPTPSPSPSPTGSTGSHKHVLTGYWQDFDNGATDQRISDVNSAYDIIAVAFANADATPGEITFSIDPTLASKLGGYTAAQFEADIAAKHTAGKKVILSVGGQNGTISVSDSTSAANFANSAYALMQQYGFDGVDIDLENGVNATYMGQALHALAAKKGAGLVLTLAPQTIDMQSTGTAYFQLALNVKDILTIVNTQYYNSGTMLGCDGNVYAEGTENFLTALACIQLQGGLNQSQVGLGVPASTSAAGSGYTSPSIVDNALDCLASGTNCGSFKPSTTWPGIGGAMTWSTNWDASNGNQIATVVGGHLHAMS